MTKCSASAEPLKHKVLRERDLLQHTMSAKAVREHYGKTLLARHLGALGEDIDSRGFLVRTDRNDGRTWAALLDENPWAKDCRLVAKPDQLIKRRGKAGLVYVNKSIDEVKAWVDSKLGQTVEIDGVEGVLHTFLVEPFVPHAQDDEFYVAITSDREGETLLFCRDGGVDVGDVDAKATKLKCGLDHTPTLGELEAFVGKAPVERRLQLAKFYDALLKCYRDLHFTLLEINPLVVNETSSMLDLAAKLDETASFLCQSKWGPTDLPAPFGRPEFPEEAYIRSLDAKTGASLKLTILNVTGRVWTLVAGGGASVVYADTICDLGFAHELANYGEYSGAPTDEQTFNYARTVLGLMTRTKRKDGKVLIVGGGIANFTDVAATFRGLVKALKLYRDELLEGSIKIYIRRAGPNYQEGLKMMLKLRDDSGLFIRVFGPEQDAVAVCPLALGLVSEDSLQDFDPERREVTIDEKAKPPAPLPDSPVKVPQRTFSAGSLTSMDAMAATQFTDKTRCIVYGLQTRAVQGMLDFDFMCKRPKPSVAAVVYPFQGHHYSKFYWGTEETLVPVYPSLAQACVKHGDASVLVNFASYRSVFDTCVDCLENHSEQIRTLAIIAEGVPERQTRDIIQRASQANVALIGPATVGGIKPGCFRIGNTGGMLDNIVLSKLYRPGSVCYVSKSGGMSNELNNIICKNSDGVCEGVAIGGDTFPGSRFVDHLLRYEANPDCKILVLLGEVGGADEYDVCTAIEQGRLTKPLVAWCIGTCASAFSFEVQFGHAGACARGLGEAALDKNKALKEAGCIVPVNFAAFGSALKGVYENLVRNGTITPKPEPDIPRVPLDYTWAKRLGMVRKPANFISTISDDRGEELTYCGTPISEVFRDDLGVGGVLCLLWFKKRLPKYATRFVEMVLMV